MDTETTIKSHLEFTTQFSSHHCVFEWHIKDFTRHFTSSTLHSPIFSPTDECRTKWQMSLNSVDGVMNINFRRRDPFKHLFKGVFTLSVQNTKWSVLDLLTTGDIYNFAGFRMSCPVATGILFTKIGEIFQLEEDDTLVLKLLIEQTDCCIDTKVNREWRFDLLVYNLVLICITRLYMCRNQSSVFVKYSLNNLF